jgi:hypothetical protein
MDKSTAKEVADDLRRLAQVHYNAELGWMFNSAESVRAYMEVVPPEVREMLERYLPMICVDYFDVPKGHKEAIRRTMATVNHTEKDSSGKAVVDSSYMSQKSAKYGILSALHERSEGTVAVISLSRECNADFIAVVSLAIRQMVEKMEVDLRNEKKRRDAKVPPRIKARS